MYIHGGEVGTIKPPWHESPINIDITYYILHITYYILPIDCLLIAYRLPLMPICSAIMDMGPGRVELLICMLS